MLNTKSISLLLLFNFSFMTFLLTLHSFLRWILLVILVVVIVRQLTLKGKSFTAQDKTWNLRLLIITHLQLVIGLLQYFLGNKGLALIEANGMKACMQNATLRFWTVEHPTGMLIAIALITAGYSITKKAVAANSIAKRNTIFILNLIAFIIIIATIPWPFREAFTNLPWLRGL